MTATSHTKLSPTSIIRIISSFYIAENKKLKTKKEKHKQISGKIGKIPTKEGRLLRKVQARQRYHILGNICFFQRKQKAEFSKP